MRIRQYSGIILRMGIAFNRRLPVPARPQAIVSSLVPEFDELGLCLLESVHAPDFLMEWTRHPYLKVITVLRGSGEFFEDRGIDEAAAELGLSRRRFTQLFNELAGESYAARIRQLRLARACGLLRESGLSPAAVAFECGYSDLSTFYRAFKKETGTSPAAWAKG